MKYSEMSDAQISKKVGEIISRDGLSQIGFNGKAFIHHYSAPVGEFGELCLGWKEFDPCNSWSDAGPIIDKHKIDLVWYELDACWGAHKGMPCAYEKSPIRAAMIVFLKTQEKPDAA